MVFWVCFGLHKAKSILKGTSVKQKFIAILLARSYLAPLQQYHQLGPQKTIWDQKLVFKTILKSSSYTLLIAATSLHHVVPSYIIYQIKPILFSYLIIKKINFFIRNRHKIEYKKSVTKVQGITHSYGNKREQKVVIRYKLLKNLQSK